MSLRKLTGEPYYSSLLQFRKGSTTKDDPHLRWAELPFGSIYLSLQTIKANKGRQTPYLGTFIKNLKLGKINLGHLLLSITAHWGQMHWNRFSTCHSLPRICNNFITQRIIISCFFVTFTNSLDICSVTVFPFLPSLSVNSSGPQATGMPKVQAASLNKLLVVNTQNLFHFLLGVFPLVIGLLHLCLFCN